MWLTILSDQLPVISLGEPLPHQLADRRRAHQKVTGLAVPVFNYNCMCNRNTIWVYLRFREAIPGFKEDYSPVTHPFAARLLSALRLQTNVARLACLIHAASVHSEPGSNSQKQLGF